MEITENEYYWMQPPYGKDRQIYKCLKYWYEQSEGQYRGIFISMTDTYHSNSIGTRNRLNEIEMEYYIRPISDLAEALKTFKPNQIHEELLKQLDNGK